MSGNFFNKYPYTDFHELNLDWILKTIKDTEKKVDDFTVFNTITWGGIWDASKSYTKWTVVQTPDGNGYISINAVPPNAPITNTTYWTEVAKYNDLYAAFNDRINAAQNSADSAIKVANEIIPNVKKLPYMPESRILTVGKSGAQFTTINSAITEAKLMEPTDSNPVTIFIYPGTYNESIVITDNTHGIHFVGSDKYSTIISFNGGYPDCVIHVDGGISFNNLTINNTSNSTYAIHYDIFGEKHGGSVEFNNCRIFGGSRAIGCGLGQDSTVIMKNSYLQKGVYVHNAPYAGTTNQWFECINCVFGSMGENSSVMVDDAANSYGLSTTAYLLFSGNSCEELPGEIGRVLFRKNTNDSSQDKHYVPTGDKNVVLLESSNNNSNMPGINYGQGKFDYNGYLVCPSTADYGASTYTFNLYIPDWMNALRYSRKINSCTVPGFATVDCSIATGQITEHSVPAYTSNINAAGRGLVVNYTLELTA